MTSLGFPQKNAQALLIAPATAAISVVLSLGCTLNKDISKCLKGTWEFTGEAFKEGVNMTFYAFEEDQYDKGEYGFFSVLSTLFGGLIQLNQKSLQAHFQPLNTAEMKKICQEAKELKKEELCLTNDEREEFLEYIEVINALQETSSSEFLKRVEHIHQLNGQSIIDLKEWHHQKNMNLFNQAVEKGILPKEALTAVQKISRLIQLRGK